MEQSIQTITPEKAAELMQKNTRNRSLNQRLVSQLESDIVAGKWQLNGESIKLSGDTLLDGQHRLQAIINTGIPIKTLLVQGLPVTAFNTIDTGRSRSLGDILSIGNYSNAVSLGSALKVVQAYEMGKAVNRAKIRNHEALDLMHDHYGLVNTFNRFFKTHKKRIMSVGLATACHYLFSKHDPDLADEFIESAIDGLNLSAGSPWYTLNKRLLQNSMAQSKLRIDVLFAFSIKTWNAVRLGKTIKVLRYDPSTESRPKIV